MSSILKALRKLEEEKAARREGGLDIGRDILRGTAGHRSGFSWRLPAAIAGTIILLGWGGYELLVPSTPILPGPPVAPTTPVPPAHRDVSQTASLLPRTVAAEPAIVEETIDSQEPASANAARSRPVVAPARPLPPAAKPPAATPTIQPPPPAVPESPQAAPSLLLTAIAYNENPDARLAVINDLPVMIGTSVEDATVEDILKDRVRLKRNGRDFEIRLQN